MCDLGAAYEHLLNPRRRASQATYYTPPEVAAAMVRLSIGLAVARMISSLDPRAVLHVLAVDPSCGGGVFLVEAARFIAAAYAGRLAGHADPGLVRVLMPEVMAECVFGMDRDPVALDLARAALWAEMGGGNSRSLIWTPTSWPSTRYPARTRSRPNSLNGSGSHSSCRPNRRRRLGRRQTPSSPKPVAWQGAGKHRGVDSGGQGSIRPRPIPPPPLRFAASSRILGRAAAGMPAAPEAPDTGPGPAPPTAVAGPSPQPRPRVRPRWPRAGAQAKTPSQMVSQGGIPDRPRPTGTAARGAASDPGTSRPPPGHPPPRAVTMALPPLSRTPGRPNPRPCSPCSRSPPRRRELKDQAAGQGSSPGRSAAFARSPSEPVLSCLSIT